MEALSFVRGPQSRPSSATRMTPGKGPVWVVFAVITSTGCIGPHVAPQDKRDASAVTARSEPAAETVDAPRTATPPTGVPVPIPPIVGVGSTDASRPDDVPVVEVRPVVVASTRESYSVSNSTTATKTDTPIHETPASIQVVPRQVIEDQKTPRMKDALENVSGVRPNQSIGSGNRFIIRGFPDLGKTYRNGLLATSPSGFPFEMDTANIDSIEVLKGPASILYGRIEPGGMINVNTKRPVDITHGALEQQFGSYSFYRTLVGRRRGHHGQQVAVGPVRGRLSEQRVVQRLQFHRPQSLQPERHLASDGQDHVDRGRGDLEARLPRRQRHSGHRQSSRPRCRSAGRTAIPTRRYRSRTKPTSGSISITYVQ
jgi:outer membrane receptor protein involved in Fe transport